MNHQPESGPYTLVVVKTGAEFEEALALRYAVFCDEQQIPRELEKDAEDGWATHLLARDAAGKVAGTGRVLRQLADECLVGIAAAGRSDDLARIGRMAVRASDRRSGLGRQILEALEACAREAGLQTAALHAQLSAEPFYLRCGYRRFGLEFSEVDIPHVEMRKSL
jgi:predicted GNAT family N-acyltransferase